MREFYSFLVSFLVKNWTNLNMVIPWYKKIQGSIGKTYFGDSTGPVIVKKYKTYRVVR